MLSRLLPDRFRYLFIGGFFSLLLGLGLIILPDYGTSTDEGLSRLNGQVSLLYLFQKLPISLQQRLLDPYAASHMAGKEERYQMANYTDRDYGVAFELPVTIGERLFHLQDERAIFVFRHLCTFLVCYLGVWGMFWLGRERFGSWRAGLLTAVLLALSPRLFAESFYNDKDVVFMSLFALAMFTAVRFLKRPSLSTAAWHALLCALTIDVRIMGILVPAATLAMVSLRLLRNEYPNRPQALRATGLYVLLAPALVVTFWPYLWEAPLAHFVEAFQNMSHFRWTGYVLHQGVLLRENNLPWSYAPVWISITTPLLYMAALAVGTGVILAQLVRRSWRLYATDAEWQDLLFLGTGLAPLLAVIVLHSVLYDGWRQLYFVYPMLLMVAMRGLVAIWRWQPTQAAWWQPAVAGIAGLCLLVTAGQMIQLHPYQNTYFNSLARQPVEANYAVDYWGLSYRQGFEWIVQHESRPVLRVCAPLQHASMLGRLMLQPNQRTRIELVEKPEQADYFVTNYIFHPQPYPYPGPAYAVRAGGMRLLGVYHLR